MYKHQSKTFVTLAISLLILVGSNPVLSSNEAGETSPSHALSMYGEHKYPSNFKHFDYVNPNAPKGGTLRLGVVSTSGFDSLNPFIIKGIPAAGMTPLDDSLLYQSLATKSDDEPFTQYGLIAEKMETPEDRSWVIFHLNPKAAFHDGHPIDAQDVVFTFNLLMEKGSPLFSAYYKNVTKVEALDNKQVKFTFNESENRELPLIVSQLVILPEHYWQDKDFTKTSLTPPLGSGPYRIHAVDPGRSITYERVENWWGASLNVSVGRYNFDKIQIDYYRDSTVAIEALKAGEYDLRSENESKKWATSYTGPRFDNGDIIKTLVPDGNPDGMQAYIFNTRREIFKDPRVRQALGFAFDFEWANQQLFYGQYQRTHSYFSGSELAATELPSKEELAILTPFKDQIPPEVFTQVYRAPSTDVPGGFRSNLRKAIQLLKQAGWQIKEGKLIDENGVQMSFELIYASPTFERIYQPFIKNLQRLGVDARLRFIDSQQYVERMNNFDFDLTSLSMSQSSSPGNEQREYWSSAFSQKPGSRNYIGINDPVIDELVELVISAPSREQLIYRTRALDRVLQWSHYVIPQWRYSYFRLVYWDKFEQPDVSPTYDVGLYNWWFKTP